MILKHIPLTETATQLSVLSELSVGSIWPKLLDRLVFVTNGHARREIYDVRNGVRDYDLRNLLRVE